MGRGSGGELELKNNDHEDWRDSPVDILPWRVYPVKI
jgi:hypothetical protein